MILKKRNNNLMDTNDTLILNQETNNYLEKINHASINRTTNFPSHIYPNNKKIHRLNR